jgi:hypothetical protein
MAKQTFTTGQVLTAAQMTSLQQTAMLGGDTTAKIASYVLLAADAGTTVAMSNAGSTTITVNTALFTAGDIVTIQNRGAGVCTITAGTATVNTSGSLVLAQYQGGVLYFTSTSAAIFFQFATPESGDITGVTVTAPITGGGTSGSVGIGISAASTSASGAVQLSDSTSTTSSVLASTPTATKAAYDLADGAIAKSVVTTAGDIIYRNATVPVRLGIGTAGQLLQVNSGATAPEWVTPAASGFVGASAFRTNSNLAVNTGVATAVTMTSESFDTNGFHDNSTNTSRMTIPAGKAGKYLLVGSISFDSVAVNSEIRWYKNGAAIGVGYLAGIVNRNAGGVYGNGASLIVDAAVADYYEMFAHQTNTNVNLNYAVFSIVYLGA